ncbi:PREDICTED: LOC110745843, partial [Prunus dulcis]
LAETKEMPEQQADNARTGGTAKNPAAEQFCFPKPTREMANHLRPLFITANLGGIPISKIMIDG